MDSTSLSQLASQQYVLLTTFRRTGEAVDTPVWVAADGDRLLVMSASSAGKVKRLRHTSRVHLKPCSARGAVLGNAVPVMAEAEVKSDADTLVALDAALVRKYGFQYRLLRVGQKLRRKAQPSVALVITPAS